ncbi:MAG TPA: multiheme c-type cytochrome [Planctomycetota bacterium]|nr:multiheme c-type cytochrome [Planctomycetota bacterium]
MGPIGSRSRPSAVAAILCIVTGLATAGLRPAGLLPLPTTLNDFFQPGSQPLSLVDPIQPAQNCSSCHGYFDPEQEPFERWKHSLMAQSMRDPIFHACLAIVEQDLGSGGDLCLRCHTPTGWLDGRSRPTDGSALDPNLGDFDGVNCHFCHRMVDPVYTPGEDPAEDVAIHASVGPVPADPHSAQYIVDPFDRRRGPFDLGPNFFWHEWLESPFHQQASLCGTCHDVSNPAFSRNPQTGAYELNALDAPHPTQEKRDEFPVERTFSEWASSDFAERPVELRNRYGGNTTAYATCQDCHMPDTTGEACAPGLGGELRDDLPQHDFNGGNTWVLNAIRSLYPDSETGMTPEGAADSIARSRAMLVAGLDLDVFERDNELVVRLINQTGHKLPTGYPEGRRMWINVRFIGPGGALLGEHGHYDPVSAELTHNTTVFEQTLGLDAAMAQATGLPVGESFHFALNNVVLFDNRIPPRGFTLDGFKAAQAEPVGEDYPEEYYWHDSAFLVPPRSIRALVSVYYQTTSREYIEFLRDENTTTNAGQIAYDQWVLHGKSAPATMQRENLDLTGPSTCSAPITFGSPTVTSGGSVPSILWRGTPSMLSGGFSLRLEDSAPSSNGVLLSSPQSDSEPFGGGTLYLAQPLTREAFFTTDDAGDSPTLPIPIDASMVDTERHYQFWVRDAGALRGSNLSPALHVDFCE